MKKLLVRVLVCAVVIGILGYGALWLLAWRTQKHQIDNATRFARESGNPVIKAIERFRAENGRWPEYIHQDLVPTYIEHVEPGLFFYVWEEKAHLSQNMRPYTGADDIFLDWDFDKKQWRFGNRLLSELGDPAVPE